MGTITQQAQSLTVANPRKRLQDVLSRSWDRIAAVMPREMNANRLYQMYVSTINREPELANCSVESVLSCFMRCTSLGLEPSNVNGLGMAYILPYGNKNRKGQKDATLIIGYKGMIELARRSGNLKSIHAQAVYQGDEFSYWEDETGQHFMFKANPNVAHKPELLTDVYVNAQLMNGGFIFEHMTRREVDDIMRRSPSARSGGPWKTDYEAMALKTVIRRSFKYLPVSVEARQAAEADETTPDYSDIFNPVLPNEDEDTPASGGETDETPVEDSSSDDRLDPMWEGFDKLGIQDTDLMQASVEKIIGHPIQDPHELTDKELQKVLDDLNGAIGKDTAQ